MLEGGGWGSIASRELEFEQYKEPKIGNGSKTFPPLQYTGVYPRLNQGEWGFPLVHSQHKLDSVAGGGAQG